MKPYGVPRDPELQWPDKQTIKQYGLKPSIGQFPGKSGDYHSCTHSAQSRNATRRHWKKRERVIGKKIIKTELE